MKKSFFTIIELPNGIIVMQMYILRITQAKTEYNHLRKQNNLLVQNLLTCLNLAKHKQRSINRG